MYFFGGKIILIFRSSKVNNKVKLGVRSCFSNWGSGLVFCLSQKSHTNALKFNCKDDNDIDISYLQDEDEIATFLRLFIQRGVARNVMH